MFTVKKHKRGTLGESGPLRVIFAGGGTGGHLFPAIALAQELRHRDPETPIRFVSTGLSFERATLARYGFPLSVIPAEGIKGKSPMVILRAVVKAVKGVAAAWKLVRGLKADLVVSVGSYAAGAVALAGWLARVPLVLQEQNTVPGITHRMLKFMARRVYVTFPASAAWFPAAKVRMLGNPLRREFLVPGRKEKRDAFTVLILGGSQGAHALNRAIIEGLSAQCRDLIWIHQTGVKDETWVRETYEDQGIHSDVRAFFTDMAAAYRRADLVVCRAGATTISELTALGKPAIFIPFPHAADDHQTQNAREMVNKGAAEIIMESELASTKLMGRIFYYRNHPEALKAMGRMAADLGRPQAARDIVDDWHQLLARPSLAG